MDSDRQRAVESAGGRRPVLIVGAGGKLGETMTAAFAQAWPVVAWTRADVDLTDGARVRAMAIEVRPSAIVNCAGYNDVDGAEEHQVEALEVNAFAVRALARAAAETGATLVHYSSDFVFDGDTDRPYREDDRPNPRSVYAASKLLGEWFAADVPSHYVLRVESLFGGLSQRAGSLDRIIAAIAAGGTVRVFVDRVVSPSYVWDVASATATLLRTRPAPGTYHCVNSGAATWYDVAREVQRRLGTPATLEPITLDDAALKAPRPRYCALANDKLAAAGITMPAWQNALARALAGLAPGAPVTGTNATTP